MRSQRREIKLLKGGGADQEHIDAKLSRYREAMRQYRVFSEHMGLPQQRERIYLDGLGRIA
jgi:hypothetical protein